MSHDALGQTLALLCAVAWAFALVLFKVSGERVTPVGLNLFKNAVGLVLLVATLVVLAATGANDVAALCARPGRELGLLIISGVLGITVADSLFFRALNLIGVGLISIVDCCYTPWTLLFSWWLLGEKLGGWQLLGAGLVVAAVLTATAHKPPADRTRGQIIGGALLALTAIGLMSLSIVMVKPILEHTPVFAVTTLRMAAGFAGLALFALADPAGGAHWAVFRPAPVWRPAILAAVLGSYLSLVMWVASFKFTSAAIAGVLGQTSVIFAIVLAALLLKESFDWRKVAAVGLAVAGVLLVVPETQHRITDWVGAAVAAVVR